MSLSFHHHALPNGLTLLTEVNPAANTSAIGFFVRTGSRDEQAPRMGISHFLEHMMFKGTARRSAEDVNREFDEIGANYNAFTSQEMTAYYAQVLPEFLPLATDLLADILRPALRPDDFTMEKNVILEEISMYQDRPIWRLQDTLLETYFRGHPLGYRVLGTAETVTSLAVDEMQDYFQRRYAPDNIIVAAAGRIDDDALLSELTALTAAWTPSSARREHPPVAPTAQRQVMTDPKLARHYLAVMLPGPCAQDESRYAAKVLADILGDEEGSRLYWALVDPGFADEADLSHYPQDGTGSYLSFATCAPDRAAQVEQILLKILDHAPDVLDAQEIDRAKNKIATRAILAGETPLGRMRGLGGNWLYLNRYRPLEDEIQSIMDVTPREVRDLAAQLAAAPRTLASLGPA
ncbi:MAG: insulinase family protein [Phycisphaeraceae bacterium]|nr:insulinase family protein [Phycisphaeraceae bacterium]